jgi:hypothetical protein
MNHEGAREFLRIIYNSKIPLRPFNINTWSDGTLGFFPHFTAVWEPEHCFNFRYDGMYYSNAQYFLEDGKLVLNAIEDYINDIGGDWREPYIEHFNYVEVGSSVEITFEDLKNLEVQVPQWWTLHRGIEPETDDGVLAFYRPFN